MSQPFNNKIFSTPSSQTPLSSSSNHPSNNSALSLVNHTKTNKKSRSNVITHTLLNSLPLINKLSPQNNINNIKNKNNSNNNSNNLNRSKSMVKNNDEKKEKSLLTIDALLKLAINNDDIKSVNAILNDKKMSPALLGQLDKDGSTPLLLAIKKGNVEVVKAIINYIKTIPKESKELELIFQLNKSGCTALIDAISKGRTEIVKAILSYAKTAPLAIQTLIFQPDKWMSSPLLIAVSSFKTPKAKPELLKAIVDYVKTASLAIQTLIFQRNDKMGQLSTPLKWAAYMNNVEAMNIILHYAETASPATQALIFQLDKFGYTVLSGAIEKGMAKVAKTIISYAKTVSLKMQMLIFQPDIQGKTPLYYAATKNLVELTIQLVDKQSLLNKPSIDDEKKQSIIQKYSPHDALKQLIDKQARTSNVSLTKLESKLVNYIQCRSSQLIELKDSSGLVKPYIKQLWRDIHHIPNMTLAKDKVIDEAWLIAIVARLEELWALDQRSSFKDFDSSASDTEEKLDNMMLIKRKGVKKFNAYRIKNKSITYRGGSRSPIDLFVHRGMVQKGEFNEEKITIKKMKGFNPKNLNRDTMDKFIANRSLAVGLSASYNLAVAQKYAKDALNINTNSKSYLYALTIKRSHYAFNTTKYLRVEKKWKNDNLWQKHINIGNRVKFTDLQLAQIYPLNKGHTT